MSQQTMRQQARRDARTVTSKRRAALLERAKRLEDLAVQVMTAIGERDAAVAVAEKQAGDALREMTTVEGVTLAEAVEWCGETLTAREATRLRRLGNVVDEVASTPDFRPAAAKSLTEMEIGAAGDSDDSGGAGGSTAVG